MHLHWVHANFRVGFLLARCPESRHARSASGLYRRNNGCHKCLCQRRFRVYCVGTNPQRCCTSSEITVPDRVSHGIRHQRLHVPTPCTYTMYPHHIPTPYTHNIYPQQNDTSSFAAASSMRAASDLVLGRVIRRCVRALHTIRATISQ